ncbi:hypothetical protein J1TS3_13980 [Siminovitchia fordii]|uniref:Uncharacterized protein n=1 Tax=Siminovitchia fordii TaxID=254759 RepID=A0ABQ4K3F0_9BACI|nr:hypothetical protein J1TS3_13980 [Siminovitchia fordii]
MDQSSFDEKNAVYELLFQLDMEGSDQKTYAMIYDSGTMQFFIEKEDFSQLYYYIYSL